MMGPVFIISSRGKKEKASSKVFSFLTNVVKRVFKGVRVCVCARMDKKILDSRRISGGKLEREVPGRRDGLPRAVSPRGEELNNTLPTY